MSYRNTWSRGGGWDSSFIVGNGYRGASRSPTLVIETTVASATAATPAEAPKPAVAAAASTAKKYMPIAIAAGLAYLFFS